jgi:hypothetical protein
MDAQLIEKMDKRRYKYLLWITIGLSIFYPMMIAERLSVSGTAQTIFALLSLSGCVIFFTALVKMNCLTKEIGKNANLNTALNNELILHYRYKSLRIGFASVIVLAGIFYFAARWIPTANYRDRMYDNNVCRSIGISDLTVVLP